ncbi:hypothetical protein P154DRAFT_573085 [Amniculicola lignicola CBS 123094]|uniref:Uncharacterized protein n=1 Tax=Amniculicola lignicola CBS 123094 TaxID=1392246 RepID=A0A6A5X0Q2_9PLEO|nr:hypothetical protein P154DRAFT_573085 [Amniculicola lignicola CBS 123094]
MYSRFIITGALFSTIAAAIPYSLHPRSLATHSQKVRSAANDKDTLIPHEVCRHFSTSTPENPRRSLGDGDAYFRECFTLNSGISTVYNFELIEQESLPDTPEHPREPSELDNDWCFEALEELMKLTSEQKARDLDGLMVTQSASVDRQPWKLTALAQPYEYYNPDGIKPALQKIKDVCGILQGSDYIREYAPGADLSKPYPEVSKSPKKAGVNNSTRPGTNFGSATDISTDFKFGFRLDVLKPEASLSEGPCTIG